MATIIIQDDLVRKVIKLECYNAVQRALFAAIVLLFLLVLSGYTFKAWEPAHSQKLINHGLLL